MKPKSALIEGTYTAPASGNLKIVTLRQAETMRLVHHRHGEGRLPNRDEARALARAIASNFPDSSALALAAMEPWCQAIGDGERFAIADDPEWLEAAEYGQLLRLTKAERKALGISVVKAMNVSATEMAADNLRVNRERKAAVRAEARRSNPKPPPWDELEPWKALGIGRSKFFQLKKAVLEEHPDLGSSSCTKDVRSKLIELVRTKIVHAAATRRKSVSLRKAKPCLAFGMSPRTFARKKKAGTIIVEVAADGCTRVINIITGQTVLLTPVPPNVLEAAPPAAGRIQKSKSSGKSKPRAVKAKGKAKPTKQASKSVGVASDHDALVVAEHDQAHTTTMPATQPYGGRTAPPQLSPLLVVVVQSTQHIARRMRPRVNAARRLCRTMTYNCMQMAHASPYSGSTRCNVGEDRA
ncbi:hypothetical protein APY04_2773 [Hyphomicrobium sulfonivorans]|uniref:Uncharacterized protein n=1 Tax=Hyphomicrobium sulfonivorans TaxID=121290 RepID=A0A120CU17_HYPSL|nr:hypothetical protein [Hyphomicrobium sulfonivorans]KWT65535.1 hypothetical protein APY04_2773 [Hyphomicrobium sulfonivorans]